MFLHFHYSEKKKNYQSLSRINGLVADIFICKIKIISSMKMSKTQKGLAKKSQTNRALEADINRNKEREVMSNSCNCFGKFFFKRNLIFEEKVYSSVFSLLTALRQRYREETSRNEKLINVHVFV